MRMAVMERNARSKGDDSRAPNALKCGMEVLGLRTDWSRVLTDGTY